MKYILILLILISTNVIGQTNYNTILNPSLENQSPIDLHLEKSKKISNVSTVLHVAGLVSLTALYYIAPTKPIGFILPASFITTSIGCHFWSGYEYKKSKEYLEYEEDAVVK